MRTSLLLTLALLVSCAFGSELTDVQVVSDRILSLHFVDGRTTFERIGQSYGTVESDPLDMRRAMVRSTYSVVGTDDPGWTVSATPVKVGRKSKGRDFVHLVNGTGFVWEHWLYLVLPRPLKDGRSYRLVPGGLAPDKPVIDFTYSTSGSRSEAVQVNQVGYLPDGPKFGYVSAWLGDLGPLDLSFLKDRRFRIVDETGRTRFEGTPRLRKPKEEKDSPQKEEEPYANYTRADLWECDFSSFTAPGRYRLAVDGIGCSFPFEIGPNVYQAVYLTTMKGIFDQRCGIPIPEQGRPACHLPKTKPYLQTDSRYMDDAHHDGWPDAQKHLTGEKRRDVWGGYHDAGDWDREDWHIWTPLQLTQVYLLKPSSFKDRELSIPENHNGIPDILDEAAWTVDFWRRIQRRDGGVSVGWFEDTWPKPGWTSWNDPMNRYMYLEDPKQSFSYAACAARLAQALQVAGKGTKAKGYLESSVKAYRWAGKNLRTGDEAKVKDARFLASAALYAVTQEPFYLQAFERDLLIRDESTPAMIWGRYDQLWGSYFVVSSAGKGLDGALKARLEKAIVNSARQDQLSGVAMHGRRQAYNPTVPLWWGNGTVPKTIPLMMAYAISHASEFRDAIRTTVDFTLGANPLNMVWVTQFGSRSPQQIVHWDSWYTDDGKAWPGIVPMGPSRIVFEKSAGPWESGWAQQNATYPDYRSWPAYELWFEDRLCASTNEFTVTTISETAAAFAYLKGG